MIFLISFPSFLELGIDGNPNVSTELNNIKIELKILQNRVKDLSPIKQHGEETEVTESISKNETCLTKECIKSSFNIFSKIDLSVDPCEDFYRFSCGKYMKEAIIPEDKARITAITPLRDIGILKLFNKVIFCYFCTDYFHFINILD